MFDKRRKIRRSLSKYGKTAQKSSHYSAFRSSQQEPKRREHPRIRKIKKALSLAAIITATGLLTYAIFFSGYFNIREITVQTENLDNETLAADVKNSITSYLGENLIFTDPSEIESTILESFPQLEKIEIDKDYPHTIVLTFEEYPLTANIVSESPNLKKTYIINSIGYAIKEDYENPQLPFIHIYSDEPINTETPIIDKTELDIILNTTTYYEDKFGMEVTKVIYKPIAREFHLITDHNFAIWLDIQKPTEDQLKKLKKILVKLDIYSLDLEYIDLRIAGNNGDKIIYKRR